jgi:predicted transcriptional regulator
MIYNNKPEYIKMGDNSLIKTRNEMYKIIKSKLFERGSFCWNTNCHKITCELGVAHITQHIDEKYILLCSRCIVEYNNNYSNEELMKWVNSKTTIDMVFEEHMRQDVDKLIIGRKFKTMGRKELSVNTVAYIIKTYIDKNTKSCNIIDDVEVYNFICSLQSEHHKVIDYKCVYILRRLAAFLEYDYKNMLGDVEFPFANIEEILYELNTLYVGKQYISAILKQAVVIFKNKNRSAIRNKMNPNKPYIIWSDHIIYNNTNGGEYATEWCMNLHDETVRKHGFDLYNYIIDVIENRDLCCRKLRLRVTSIII